MNANANVKVFSDIDMRGGGVNLSATDTVPDTPKVGGMYVISGVIHFYTSVDGSDPFMMPIASKRSSYIHTQVEAATEWNITHDLGTTDILVQIYDDSNNMVYATPIFLNIDEIKIEFTEGIAGRAIVFGVSSKFSGFRPNAESLTSDTVVFGEGEPGDFSDGSIYFQV